jgi:hypothetical protein
MTQYNLGGSGDKRVIETTPDGSITISKKNGKVLKVWNISEIEGIAFVRPGNFGAGRLAFCESYQDSLVQTMSTVVGFPNSIQVMPSQAHVAEEIIAWFNSNKVKANSQSPYDMEIVQKGSILALQGMTVIIRHTGVVRQIARGGMQGEKRILVKSILSIQFKKPTDLTLGYIQFETAGSSQNAARGGLLEGAGDENTILFDSNKVKEFELFRDKVEQLMNQDFSSKPVTSDADELAKFAKLRDEGIITEEEFSIKKKMILGL